jgi:hypothetical protein
MWNGNFNPSFGQPTLLTPPQITDFLLTLSQKNYSILTLALPFSCMAFKSSWGQFPPAPPEIFKGPVSKSANRAFPFCLPFF